MPSSEGVPVRWDLLRACPVCGVPTVDLECSRHDEQATTVPLGLARFVSAMEQIADLIGRGECNQNGCEGCAYEKAEAGAIARDALAALEAALAGEGGDGV